MRLNPVSGLLLPCPRVLQTAYPTGVSRVPAKGDRKSAPKLLLNSLLKDWAVAGGRLDLSVKSLGRKDLTGKSGFRMRLHWSPARLPKMALVEIWRESVAVGRGGAPSPERCPDPEPATP